VLIARNEGDGDCLAEVNEDTEKEAEVLLDGKFDCALSMV